MQNCVVKHGLALGRNSIHRTARCDDVLPPQVTEGRYCVCRCIKTHSGIWVRLQVSICGLCRGQSVTGTSFSPNTYAFLYQCHSTGDPHSHVVNLLRCSTIEGDDSLLKSKSCHTHTHTQVAHSHFVTLLVSFVLQHHLMLVCQTCLSFLCHTEIHYGNNSLSVLSMTTALNVKILWDVTSLNLVDI